jgi:hypothetical protein
MTVPSIGLAPAPPHRAATCQPRALPFGGALAGLQTRPSSRRSGPRPLDANPTLMPSHDEWASGDWYEPPPAQPGAGHQPSLTPVDVVVNGGWYYLSVAR